MSLKVSKNVGIDLENISKNVFNVSKVINMLKRKVDLVLENWKNNKDRYPLIIKGARQIGKTTSIRQFAKKKLSESS